MPRMAAPQLVRRIALDVLQRTPTAEEVAQAAPRAPIEVAQRMLGTLEAMEVWLEEELLYFLLLDNFRPTTPNVAALPRLLHERRTDVRAAQAEILLSTAFSLRNPGNDTFVTVVLEQCLGLEVQDRRNAAVLEAGKRAYDGYATRFLGGVGRSQADVVKLANILYNFELEFTKPEWQGAPLLSDGQSSDHPRAKTPSDAKASAANVLYRLGQSAIIDKVTESQKAIRAVKSATNSKRIDLVVPVVLAGTTNVIDLVIPWGFSYG